MPLARFTKAEIVRAVTAARACGLDVSGFRIGPDGALEIITRIDRPPESQNYPEPKRYAAE